jgi:hypothetical protein
MRNLRCNVLVGDWLCIAASLVSIVTVAHVRPMWAFKWYNKWSKRGEKWQAT